MSTPTASRRAPTPGPSGRPPARPRRSRAMQIAVVAISVGLLAVAALVFFLQSGSDDSGPSKKSVSANVQLTLGGIQNANAGAPATLGDDAASQIMAAVGQYVDRGLIEPVKTGQPAQNVSDLFDAGTQAAIQGPDKDVLFETGQPKRTGDFKPLAEPVLLNALSDNGGQFVLVTASFGYKADVAVQGGTLTTVRSIALTFTPENGPWKITGYDVTVTRQGAQVEGGPTTTAAKK